MFVADIADIVAQELFCLLENCALYTLHACCCSQVASDILISIFSLFPRMYCQEIFGKDPDQALGRNQESH